MLSLISTSYIVFASVFMTELTDPQNSSDAGRYVELYNAGDNDIDLSSGWSLQRWTNGNADPQSPVALTGIISANSFYIVCNDADKFNTTYGLVCDQDIGTGGAADSNGDDNIALLDADGNIADMFGVPGEDGSGTGHEFEDGRAERASGVTVGSSSWIESEWNIDNDSGGGDGNQYAPEGFDPGEWVGSSSGSNEFVVHAGNMYFTPSGFNIPIGTTVRWVNDGGTHDVNGDVSTITGQSFNNPESFYLPVTNGADLGSYTFNIPGFYNYDCSVGSHASMGMVGSFSVGDLCSDESACNFGDLGECLYNDCSGECGGSAEFDSCGECGGDGTSCSVNVTFTVDMSADGGTYEDGDMRMRVSTINGEYNPSDWYGMTANGDGSYSHTLALSSGTTYGYNFNNSDGSGYESGDGLADCAGGNYGNDRTVTPGDSDMTLDSVCWESCDACPDVILGCMDSAASNYNPAATEDDGSCLYPQPMQALFFSEHAEGSSNNKYFEVYNPSDVDVALVDYAFVNCSNGCDDWEYTNSFAEGAVVAAGSVYSVCHSSYAGDLTLCNETRTLYHNGDDAQGLMYMPTTTLLDLYGTVGDDPGSGWEVAGVANATKDHTLVRKSSVTAGNTDWATSAGTNADDSEWVVFDQDTWAYLGSHPHDFAASCGDDTACNYGQEGDCVYAEVGFDCDGNALVDITFHVNMSEQVVDTEGYGLDLFLPDPYGYHDMADEDSDGIWSVTLTLLANTDYSYKFKNGSEWEANFNDLGCGDGSDYGNRYFNSGNENLDIGPFCFSSCSNCETEIACGSGDTNGDDSINVTDIVLVVQGILGETTLDEEENCRADVTGDGVVNVTDIVNIVYIILGTGMDNNSFTDQVNVIQNDIGISISAEGIVGGIQLSIIHDKNAEINLTENSFLSEMKTEGNISTIILISPEIGQIVYIDSNFEILEMIVTDLEGEIKVNIVNEFNLLTNYPNPFNPLTNITYSNEIAGNVTLNIYDLSGRLVNTLVSNFMEIGQYNIDWDGTDNNGFDVTSGVYLLTLESESGIQSSKITLLR